MKILAIETATDACSAALLIGGSKRKHDTVSVEFELAPRQHTQLILFQVERLLASVEMTLQELDAIAFGQGPGAFTGLRIAAGVAQGLALAADLPVIPISTLAAMAQQGYQEYKADHALVALDARINEVYWGKYVVSDVKIDAKKDVKEGKNGQVNLVGIEQVILPESIEQVYAQDKKVRWIGIGSGWNVYGDELRSKVGKDQLSGVYPTLSPSAEFIARLAVSEYKQGKALPVEEAQPVYLRDKVADTIKERKAI